LKSQLYYIQSVSQSEIYKVVHLLSVRTGVLV